MAMTKGNDLEGHDHDEWDDHDPGECYRCLSQRKPVASQCRCGDCCRRLLIEVRIEDAKREPKIAAFGSPTYAPAEMTASGQRELIGYLLNSSKNDMACAFLNQKTNRCTIHATRPLVCRLFDCDRQGKELLVSLGMEKVNG